MMRRFIVGVMALFGGLLIAISGPRTVQGLGTQGLGTATAAERSVPEDGTRAVRPDPGLDDVVMDDPPEVLWDLLAGLDYRTGEIVAELQQYVGKEVKIPGFMVPLEDWAEEASEFLLVPYVGACVHTPPPPPNQLVYVQMSGGDAVPVSFWDPVWIHGTLEVEETESVYGAVSFRLGGTEVEPYEW